jgi:hypothetical protein
MDVDPTHEQSLKEDIDCSTEIPQLSDFDSRRHKFIQLFRRWDDIQQKIKGVRWQLSSRENDQKDNLFSHLPEL